MKSLLPQLRKIALGSTGGTITDAQLLESFVTHREEAAFAAIVRRHGPMVLGVCQRLLHNTHDAEDAFQATFLVLIRKAATIVPRQLVGNWLYGVAYRTALRACGSRHAAARRDAEIRMNLRGKLEQAMAAKEDEWSKKLKKISQTRLAAQAVHLRCCTGVSKTQPPLR